PRIADPQHVRVLVGAHAARALLPRDRRVVVRLVHVGVVGALVRREPVHLGLYRRETDLPRLAGGAVADADGVGLHLRPPAVAVAIGGEAIGAAEGAVGELRRRRLEFGEAFVHRIEAQRTDVGRHRDEALAVDVDGGGATGARHALRRQVDGDLVGARVDAGKTAVDVEPDQPGLVAPN